MYVLFVRDVLFSPNVISVLDSLDDTTDIDDLDDLYYPKAIGCSICFRLVRLSR